METPATPSGQIIDLLDSLNKLSVRELRNSLKESDVVIPPKLRRKAELRAFAYEHILRMLDERFSELTNMNDAMNKAQREAYNRLLQDYQQCHADYSHCDMLQSKLTTIKEQHEEKIEQVQADSNLSQVEKQEIVSELQSVVDKIEPEIEKLEASKEENVAKMQEIEVEHATELPPDAPPLVLPVYDALSHMITNSGNAQLSEKVLDAEIAIEENQLNELELARAKLKKVPVDDSNRGTIQTENEILLENINNARKKLKHTVEVKRAYEDDSQHGRLMNQIKQGVVLRKVERTPPPTQETKEEEEDESIFGQGLHMLGFGEKRNKRGQKKASAKSAKKKKQPTAKKAKAKSAKKATKKRGSKKGASSKKAKKH